MTEVPSVPECDKQIQVTGKSQPCQIWDHQVRGVPGKFPECTDATVHKSPQKISQRNAKTIPSRSKEEKRPQEIHGKLNPVQRQEPCPCLCFLVWMRSGEEAIPIMIKRIVHTTGNSHPGGDRAAYLILQNTFIPFLVKIRKQLLLPGALQYR